jgi:hypothetical protein
MFIIRWIYPRVNLKNYFSNEYLTNSSLDWYAESSLIFSGYTHTASSTESSKHVRKTNCGIK